MKINALRKELNTLIPAGDDGRKPAIRRSRREDWIYATNLPECASGERLEAIRGALAAAGWESLEEGGWMELRKTVKEPPEAWFDGPFGPEAACCRSLLSRHRRQEAGRETVYRLIRAGEEGPAVYEDVCRQLHRDWAERLRRKQELPDVSPYFFGGGD